MADYDGEMKFRIGFDMKDVKKTAKDLEKNIDEVLDSHKDTTDKNLQRMLETSKKLIREMHEVEQSIKAIEDQRTPTMFTELDEQLKNHLTRLRTYEKYRIKLLTEQGFKGDVQDKKAADDFIQERIKALSNDLPAQRQLRGHWEDYTNGIKEAQKQVGELQARIDKLPEEEKRLHLPEDLKAEYTKQGKLLETINDKVRLNQQAIEEYDKQRIQQEQDELARLKEERQKIQDQRTDFELRQAQREVDELRKEADELHRKNVQAEIDRLKAREEEVNKRLQQKEEELAQRKADYEKRKQVTDDVMSYFGISSEVGAGIKNLSNGTNLLLASLKKTGQAVSVLFGKFKALAGRAIRRGLSTISNALKGIFTHSSKAANGAKMLFKNLLKAGIGVTGIVSVFRKLKSAISEGFNNLTKFKNGATDLGRMVQEFKNNITYLKNAIATVIAPLAEQLIPIFNQLITKAGQFATDLAKSISLILGKKGMIQAIQSTNGYADSVDGATESVEGLNKQLGEVNGSLYGFDELNERSGGSGMFQEMLFGSDDTTPIFDFIKQLKDLWDEKNFKGIGEMLGNAFNKAFENLYKVISGWIPKIKEKVHNLILIFSGWLSELDVVSLADWVSEILGGFIDAVQDWIDTFPWKEFGRKMGQFVTELGQHKEIWNDMGKMLGDLFRGAIDAAWEFAQQIDPKQWADNIRSAIENFLTEMGKIDESGLNGWQKLGDLLSSIVTMILEIFTHIPWGDVITGFAQALNAFIDGLDKEVEKGVTGWDLMGDTLGIITHNFLEMFRHVHWLDIAKGIGSFLTSAWQSLPDKDKFDIGTLAVTLTAANLVIAVVKNAFISAIATALGGTVMTGAARAGAIGLIAITVGIMLTPILTHIEDVPDALDEMAEETQEAVQEIFGMGEHQQALKNLYWEGVPGIPDITKYIKHYTDVFGKSKYKLTAAGRMQTLLPGSTLKRAIESEMDEIRKEASKNSSDLGEAITNGVNAGIDKGTTKLQQTMEAAIYANPLEQTRALLKIHSPSKVYSEIGENVMLGFVQGIEGQESLAIQAINNTMRNIINSVDATLTPDLNTDSLVSGLESVIIKLTQIADRFSTINRAFDNIGRLPVPALATGGVVPANALVAKTNNISQDSINTLISALSAMTANRTETVERPTDSRVIEVNINGREVFNAVVEENNNQVRRTGRSALLS